MQPPRKVVFLDRDGVINESPGERRYVRTWREFRFRKGAIAMLAELFASGFRLVVITNQQGVGKGLVEVQELERIHDNMSEAIEQQGARLDGIHYCPHLASDGCACRKPRPGLIFDALAALEYPVDLQASWFVGDSETDIQAGHAAGLRTLLIGAAPPGAQLPSPTCVVKNIDDVAAEIATNTHPQLTGVSARASACE